MNNVERLVRIETAYEIVARVHSDLCRNWKRGADEKIINEITDALRKMLSVISILKSDYTWDVTYGMALESARYNPSNIPADKWPEYFATVFDELRKHEKEEYE